MSDFPRNSAFDRERFEEDFEEAMKTPYPQIVGSSKRLDVTEVPHEALERWYATLNDFVSSGRLRRASFQEVSDGLEELRDEVYSYLRG